MDLTRLWRKRTKLVLAVEWSGFALRIVVLEKHSNGYSLLLADSTELQATCVDYHGQVVNYVQFAETLILLLKRNCVKNRHAAFILEHGKVIVKLVQYDRRFNDQQIRDALFLDLEKHVSSRVEDTCFDYQPLQQRAKSAQQDVLLVAAHRNKVRQYEKIAKVCHLVPEVLDVDSYVLQRFLCQLYPTEFRENTCVAFVGLNTYSYSVYFLNQQETYFSEQKNLLGSLSNDVYLTTLMPWLVRNIQMFEVGYSRLTLCKVLLYGEKAAIEDLQLRLAQQIGKTLEVVNPFQYLINGEQKTTDNPSSYLLAVGLATREVVT